jgi:hypothetical protein
MSWKSTVRNSSPPSACTNSAQRLPVRKRFHLHCIAFRLLLFLQFPSVPLPFELQRRYRKLNPASAQTVALERNRPPHIHPTLPSNRIKWNELQVKTFYEDADPLGDSVNPASTAEVSLPSAHKQVSTRSAVNAVHTVVIQAQGPAACCSVCGFHWMWQDALQIATATEPVYAVVVGDTQCGGDCAEAM